MRNLIQFFVRYHYQFIFILLEVFCFLLIFKNNHYQNSSILNSTNSISANLYQASSNVKEYLLLRDENLSLAVENSILRGKLRSAYETINTSEYKITDTVYKQKYSFMLAKVVNNSTNRRNNYLTLNMGAANGVKRDMAVINSLGIVGLVKDVSENYASCLSILHKDVRVNCKLKKDGSYGPLSWEGNDPDYANLTDIPLHARIKNGDTIVTSPLSSIFPEGIMVGVVDHFERKQNESLYTVSVRLSTNFRKLNHVYIVTNHFKSEQDSLELKSQIQAKNGN